MIQLCVWGGGGLHLCLGRVRWDVLGQPEQQGGTLGEHSPLCAMCCGDIMNYIIIIIQAGRKRDKTDI